MTFSRVEAARRIVSAPVAADVSTVQTITLTGAPTGGTYTLAVTGHTAVTAYNASAASIQTAVQGWGGNYAGVTVTGSAGGPYTVTYPIGGTELADVSATALTGGTSPTAVVDPDPVPPVVNPGTAPAPPPFPTLPDDALYAKQARRIFAGAPTVAPGSFIASKAGGYLRESTVNPALADDWTGSPFGTGKHSFYSWLGSATVPSDGTYMDTRLQHYEPPSAIGGADRLIDFVCVAGSNRVTSPTGQFTPANMVHGPVYRSAMPAPGAKLPFPQWTRVAAFPAPTTTTMYMEQMDGSPALASVGGTFKSRIRWDGGVYDPRSYHIDSDNQGVKGRFYTDNLKFHHVFGMSPALGGHNGEARTDSDLQGSTTRAVLGGHFGFCVRFTNAAPSYKIAYLLYPYNNNAAPRYMGEFDMLELGTGAGSLPGFFMHTPSETNVRTGQRGGSFKLWNGTGSITSAASYTVTPTSPTDGNWHTVDFFWRPNQVDHTQSVVSHYYDGVKTNMQWGPGTINPTGGNLIPYVPCNFTLQAECQYSSPDKPIDPTVDIDVCHAWWFYRKPLGLVTL